MRACITRPVTCWPRGHSPAGAAWSSAEIFRTRSKRRPAAVFVDAVSNRPDPRVADLGELRRVLASSAPDAVTIVDTSVCSMMDPWVDRKLTAFDTPLIVVESLTKHAQLGLDRIPGGLIMTDPARADQLDQLREHLGSNVTDLACAALPDPNRSLMIHRLNRQSANASFLAGRLHAAGVAVAHPTLSNHPDQRSGPNCCIVGLPDRDDVSIVARAMEAAGRRGILIENGAGFGFDVTRIYQTTRSIPAASAFVRIAAGIESIDVVIDLTDALVEAVR